MRNRLRSSLLAIAAIAVVVLVPGPQARAAAPPPAGLEGIPRFSHVVVLVEENESEKTTFAPGSPAKYLNSLQGKGVFLSNYYGTGHASLDNYIAMTSGQPLNPFTSSDCETLSLYSCVQIQSALDGGRNLGDQLDGAGVSWKSYMDGTTTPCFHASYTAGDLSPDPYQGDSQAAPAHDYADRHNPFIYYPDFIGNQARCAAHQMPFTQLAKDVAANRLPQFSFITPDTCHDGHDDPCSSGKPGGLVSADLWASQNVPSLLNYLWHHNGVLIINFDEGSTGGSNFACPSCASGGLGGQTGALVLSPLLAGGKVVATDYDHDSLLRTVEDSFGISEHLNLAASATAMTDVFGPANRK